ncbi:Transcription accessory protein (S1 RNA-binding domain) [Mucinivorans hirudinis]|uniref:Transcription accessory protein (S1 RNA-binding domain) n=1 Tax=Mucinivorans hirudinis TaxID=1433126 RepID=A0A060RBT2_9BACT|nr:Transcription accessory protein (S1 RNA-binding domain) [Mucinivorans hirudinis]
MTIIELTAQQVGISFRQVDATIAMLAQGATVPFLSRYRKEATGGLDEVQIGKIAEQYARLQDIVARKITILETIESQGKLTGELRTRIENCWSAVELEDIYLPYKPKRTTKAEIARRRGLESLAKILMSQNENDVQTRAAKFMTEEVKSEKEALQGARDIIAEWVNEDELTRNTVRGSFRATAEIVSKVVKGKEAEGDKYLDLFDYSTPLKKCPSHRLLALRRAEDEGFIKVSINPDMEGCLERLNRRYVRGTNNSSEQVRLAVEDSFKRLLKPSIETEFAAESKLKADQEAIAVFATNLRQLLMAAPLGQKRVMGVDPGYRTGCKIVCLDAQGALLYNYTIFPHPPQKELAKSEAAIRGLIEKFEIQAIAVGNGTASRESEDFFKPIAKDYGIQLFVVSENGASIYSASEVARDEFPDYDVTVRGSVSIARRLVDPLAELVKIDPKSLGVGQYQHDVDQKLLKTALDTVVESCVNTVGVNINTASRQLLSYVSGIGDTLAQNIVDYRTANGAFRSREEIKKVARMGPKSYEQCAGFLRIDGANPLDNSAVHPESYQIVARMAADLNVTVSELIKNKELQKSIKSENYITDKVGLPTLTDIRSELEKPGRDPRGEVKALEFDDSIRKIEDLHEGMILNGIVNNVTAFGCFVDIGIKENGLVHLSQMANRFVKDANEIVKLHQHVRVRVLSVDLARGRVQLSMKL